MAISKTDAAEDSIIIIKGVETITDKMAKIAKRIKNSTSIKMEMLIISLMGMKIITKIRRIIKSKRKIQIL